MFAVLNILNFQSIHRAGSNSWLALARWAFY